MGEANSDTVKEEKEKVFYGTVPEEGRKMKRVSDSLTEASRLIIPADLNSSGRLFGGRLLEWLDEMAGIVAKRHAECSVVTAAIDNLHFKEGATVSDTIFMRGYVTWVGRSSMEVRVDTFAEKLTGIRVLINRAYFVMVGLDENTSPHLVPGLIVEGPNEEMEWESGKRRQALRKQRFVPCLQDCRFPATELPFPGCRITVSCPQDVHTVDSALHPACSNWELYSWA